jgi:hypothetical protein
VAFVAEVALEVVTFSMLVADCVNAVAACDLIPSAHASGEGSSSWSSRLPRSAA